MSIAENISPHLPYLRRFSRLLTGSQKSGDAYVVCTLEAIVSDRTIFALDLPPRVALYRTFLKILNSVPLNNRTSEGAQPAAFVRAKGNLEVSCAKGETSLLALSGRGVRSI